MCLHVAMSILIKWYVNRNNNSKPSYFYVVTNNNVVLESVCVIFMLKLCFLYIYKRRLGSI